MVINLDRLISILSGYKSVGNKEPVFYITVPDIKPGLIVMNVRVFGVKVLMISPGDEEKLIGMFKDRSLLYQNFRTDERFTGMIEKYGIPKHAS